MNIHVHETDQLEMALLRRSLHGLSAECERCTGCRRSLLVGEKVYEYPSGKALCELCRERERSTPSQSHMVHGPEFGHTLRIVDRRAETKVPSAEMTGVRAA
jgi:hypothetical protein